MRNLPFHDRLRRPPWSSGSPQNAAGGGRSAKVVMRFSRPAPRDGFRPENGRPRRAGMLASNAHTVVPDTHRGRTMDGDHDLQLLLLALRDRAVDPLRLADAAGDWGQRTGQGLMAFLVGRGVLSADDLHRLQATTINLRAAARGDD